MRSIVILPLGASAARGITRARLDSASRIPRRMTFPPVLLRSSTRGWPKNSTGAFAHARSFNCVKVIDVDAGHLLSRAVPHNKIGSAERLQSREGRAGALYCKVPRHENHGFLPTVPTKSRSAF